MTKLIKSFLRYRKGPSVSVGDFAIWTSQGVVQWDSPRRIVHVEFHADNWYAWCDGSMTAILTSELTIS